MNATKHANEGLKNAIQAAREAQERFLEAQRVRDAAFAEMDAATNRLLEAETGLDLRVMNMGLPEVA
jgi:hypothetical protein